MPQHQNKYPGFSYVQTVGGISEFRLKTNGLRVIVREDHTTPVAGCMVTYHVGSRNEALGHTGATHLLEHLMFKGSPRFNKENGNPIFVQLEQLGAKLNATTWFDRTNYFAVLPRQHLETVIAAEADRMRGAFLREADLASEMTVVRNEFEIGENDPGEVLDKNVWATAYQAQPYHHSTIGWRSDIENISIETLRWFYDMYYWPNNATVTIVGDVTTKQALQYVKRHFGAVPASGHTIPSVHTTEPAQRGSRHVNVYHDGQQSLVAVAHKVPEGLHHDQYSLNVLARILADGNSSRLHRELVDGGYASDVDIFSFPLRDPGLFLVAAELTPNTTPDTVTDRILRTYRSVQRRGVSAEEVDRAKARITAEAAFESDGPLAFLNAINEAISLGDWTYFVTYPERVEHVTADMVQAAAHTYLQEITRTTGYAIAQ
jgi:zinc protease